MNSLKISKKILGNKKSAVFILFPPPHEKVLRAAASLKNHEFFCQENKFEEILTCVHKNLTDYDNKMRNH